MQEVTLRSHKIKKPIGAIQVVANVWLLERKISNALLGNATPQLLKKRRHKMSYTALCEQIGYNSGDRERIKKALRTLSSTKMFSIDNQRMFQEFNHISSPLIIWWADYFEYGYEDGLPELLHDPEIYALIDEATQAKFDTQYALYLYENCLPFKANAKFPWKTTMWDVAVFRDLMWVSGMKYYESYREFRRKIIEPAIKVVNAQSEILIEQLSEERKGRKVVGVQFLVTDNPKNVQLKLKGIETQADLLAALDQPAVKSCIDLGIWEGIAAIWFEAHWADYLLEKLAYVQAYKSAGKIKTTEAQLLTAAVKNDYKDEKITINLEKKEKREAARLLKETEWEESEKKMAEQRKQREESRQAVQTHLHSLPKEALQEEKLTFSEELWLDPDITPSECEWHLRDLFFDWIAEKEDLWNPFPALRANCQKEALVGKLSWGIK